MWSGLLNEGGDMKKTEVVVIQSPDAQPIPAKVLAQTIIDIDTATKAMLNAGLKVSAIVALVHDSTGLPKREVRAVIDSLASLRTTWCSR